MQILYSKPELFCHIISSSLACGYGLLTTYMFRDFRCQPTGLIGDSSSLGPFGWS